MGTRRQSAFWLNLLALAAVALSAALVVTGNADTGNSNQILNVSYDSTRELFQELNQQFTAKYLKETGRKWGIQQSHGGSSRQARAVVDGLRADLVTLGLFPDVDLLRRRGLIAEGWSQRLPNDSRPFTSTIVFVVRKGNPKHIRDWPDLIGRDVSVITPNPKTSGNGKLSVLAAWGQVIRRGGTEAQARDYLVRLYRNVPVLGSGSRDATATFAYDNVGDVHLTWESEALFETEASGGELEIVYPPVSILAEPAVALVDANVAGTRKESFTKAYLRYLFTDQAQEVIARHGYRPVNAEVLRRYSHRFPAIDLFPATLLGKDWNEIGLKFFADNGILDSIPLERAAS